MSILFEYYDTLAVLEKLHTSLLSKPFIERDFKRIEVLEDEMRDVCFAIREMERMEKGFCYRPRGRTLKHRADLYVGLDK